MKLYITNGDHLLLNLKFYIHRMGENITDEFTSAIVRLQL